MPVLPAAELAFPAMWLFLLGTILSLGVWRMRRARLDVRDDWARLVRFHEVLSPVEGSRGRNEPARVELIALARALDGTVEHTDGRPGLAPQAEHFAAGGDDGIHPDEAQALAAALRRDVVAIDRALQERMKGGNRAAGRLGPVFLAGVGGVLVLPLAAARQFGLLRRLSVRHVEESLWFQGALGVISFLVLAGTAYAAYRAVTLLLRIVGSIDPG